MPEAWFLPSFQASCSCPPDGERAWRPAWTGAAERAWFPPERVWRVAGWRVWQPDGARVPPEDARSGVSALAGMDEEPVWLPGRGLAELAVRPSVWAQGLDGPGSTLGVGAGAGLAGDAAGGAGGGWLAAGPGAALAEVDLAAALVVEPAGPAAWRPVAASLRAAGLRSPAGLGAAPA